MLIHFFRKHEITRASIIILLLSYLCLILQAKDSRDGNPQWMQLANRYEKAGNLEAARKVYLGIIQRPVTQSNQEEIVLARIQLAYLQKNSRERQLAWKTIHEADSVYRKWRITSPILLGDIRHLQGTLKIMASDNRSAIKLLNEALVAKRKVVAYDDTTLSVTYNNLGMAYSNLEQFEDAILNLNLAISSLRLKKENKLASLSKCYGNLGITSARMGDYAKARDYHIRSLSEKLSIKGEALDPQNLALAYINLGQTETTLGNLDSAFTVLDKAEKLLQKLEKPETSELDVIYNLKGNLYSLLGDYEKALLFYNKSLTMLRRKSPEHPRIKEIEMNIGYTYFIRQDFQKSVEYFQSSLIQNEASANNLKTYRNMGRSLEAMGDFPRAEEYFLKAIQMAEVKYGKKHYELAASYLNYGNFLHTTNNYQQAAAYYHKAITINRTLFGEKNRDVAGCYLRLGELALKQSNYRGGLQSYQNALISLLEDFNDPNPRTNPGTGLHTPDYYLMNAFAGKGDAFYKLYQSEGQLKDLYLSYNNYKLYAQVANQIRNKISSEESNLVISVRLREILGGSLRTTTELYKVTSDDFYLSEAFRFSENGKSAILMAELNSQEKLDHEHMGTSQLESEAKKLRNNISSYKKLIHEEYKTINPKLSKIDLWREKVFELEEKLETLVKKIKSINPAYLSNRFADQSLSPLQLQNILGDETVIEYALSNDKLYTFIINKDTFLLKTTDITSDLPQLVAGYVENIRHGLLDEPEEAYRTFCSISQTLYNTLIKPVENHLTTRKLTIIPDGYLGYIPFETLIKTIPDSPVPDYRNLDYLIEHHTIRYNYVASQAFIKREKKQHPAKAFAGFAPIYRAETSSAHGTGYQNNMLRDIPGIRDEVAEIAASLQDADVYISNAATESVFKRVSGRYKVLHLALHTLIDNDNPMYSKMAFSAVSDSIEDQMLNAYEVYNLDIQAQLAVLSSCNTGTGQLIKGEGVMSLARGFIFTGVPSVVMTLWEADDESATGLMPEFYNKLTEGYAIDGALRAAKLSYLNGADRLRSHPYFWSSYVMIGSNEPIKLARNRDLYFYLVVGFAFLLTSLAVYLGFRVSKKRRSRV